MKTVWLILLILSLAPTATLHAQPRINQQHCIKLFPDSYSMREDCERTEYEEARTAYHDGCIARKGQSPVDAAIHKGVLIKVAKPSTVPLAYIGATYYSLPRRLAARCSTPSGYNIPSAPTIQPWSRFSTATPARGSAHTTFHLFKR